MATPLDPKPPTRTITGAFDWRVDRLDWPVTTEVGPGLRGVIAGATDVGWLDPGAGTLAYRGLPIERIVGWGTTFEEALHLLVTGERVDQDPEALEALRRTLANARQLPDDVLALLDELPADAHPVRLLRAGVSALGCHELSATDEISGEAHWRELRIVGQVAALVEHLARRQRRCATASDEGATDASDASTPGLAAAMLRALNGRAPSEAQVSALDRLWVLYADHGLDAPTFTSMIVASCHADPYYNVVAGLSALVGSHLGGATESVWRQLSAIDGPDSAERWVEQALAGRERIAGFGHRMYRMPDPRAAVLHQTAAGLSRTIGRTGLLEVAEAVHWAAARRLGGKGVHVNINFYAAVLFELLGASPGLFPCLYAVGRMAGLVARVREVLDRGGRLYRPLARYRGRTAPRSRSDATVTVQTYREGLDGLVLGDTTISEIDGVTGELRYRGHRLDDLAQTATFEQVSYLVLRGALPDEAELSRWCDELWRWRRPPPAALAALRRMPAGAHPLALLRTMFTVATCHQRDQRWTEAQVLGWSAALGAAAIRHLAGQPPLPLGAAPPGPGKAEGELDQAGRPSFAERFLWQALGGLAEPAAVRAFEVSLIAQAEHGLHAAALAALVTISTGADLGSAVLAGMGALSGARHGGANQLAHEVLQRLDGPEQARRWATGQLSAGARFAGFGHRVYKCPDPRVRVLEPHARSLLDRRGMGDRWETYRALRQKVEGALGAKGVFANVDSITGLIYGPLGLAPSAMSIPFCLAIQTGWMAHCREYLAAGGPMIEPAAVLETGRAR